VPKTVKTQFNLGDFSGWCISVILLHINDIDSASGKEGTCLIRGLAYYYKHNTIGKRGLGVSCPRKLVCYSRGLP